MSQDAKLPRNVVALGWVSLLTDAASDMIYPLVPVFLRSLGGGALSIGWLEGVAEGVSALVKLRAGALADRRDVRPSRLIALGYGLAAVARPFYAVATHPLHAVLVRALDRVGKGLRGPPRDAVIASSIEPARRGHAFGYHRMMDNAGGVVGGLLAFALLRFGSIPLRTLFALAAIPGLTSVLVTLVFVSDPPRPPPAHPATLAAGRAPLPALAIRYFVALGVFSLAGSGDMFLVLRLGDLGLDPAYVPLAWVGLQLAKAVLNVPGGKAADRHGRARLVVLGWVLYAASYCAFGVAGSVLTGCLALLLYAGHYGLVEGGQRALLAELVPPEAQGRGYGVQLAIEGLAVLPANVAFGVVYDRIGGPAAFVGAGALALAGAALLATVARRVPASPR